MRTLIKLAVGAIAALAALFVIGMFVGILGAAFSAGGTSSNVGGDGGGQAQQEPAQRPEPEPSAQATKPQEPEDYLHVTGTPGIPFSCSIMHGDMRQTTVDGTVPQKIKLEDMGFGAMSENVCQKTGARGTLKVAIYVGGDMKASNQTSAQYGVVTVGYPQ